MMQRELKSLMLAETWDLTLDGSGNLAAVSGAPRTAQDVASAVRTFRGECLYHTDRGIPYLDRVFGLAPHLTPSLTLVRQLVAEEATKVPAVNSARTELLELAQGTNGQTENTGRMVTGRIRITTENGENVHVQF